MKNTIILLTLIQSQFGFATVESKTPVSVTAFKQKAATGYDFVEGCHGWGWFTDLGNAFSDVLVEKLNAYSKYEVLERANINSIYENEVTLINSHRDKSIQKGGFKKAKITFVGVVDGFEYCQNGSSVAVDVGSIFGIGNITPKIKNSTAKISLMIRAIDTTSGKIIATARSKKSQDKQSLGVDVFVSGVSARGNEFKQSMLGETIQEAVEEATSELVKKL